MMEYFLHLPLGVLVSVLGFYLIREKSKRPRKRDPIFPTNPVAGDPINDTTCILLSDGSSRFSDGSIVVETKKSDS